MSRRTEKLELLLSELREEVLMMDSNYKGKKWEADFASACRDRGFIVENPTGREDMRVNGLRVQCKHIDQVRDSDRIDITNRMPVKSNGGFRGYAASECDVFAIKHMGDLFLIPVASICDERRVVRRCLSVASLYRFRNHWEVFETGYEPPRAEVQSLLFGEKEP